MKTCPTCREAFESGEVFCPNDGARLRGPSIELETRSDDPLVGTVLQERYRILRRIGEGGMGFVYEAEHELIEKRVAVKVLRADLSSRSDLVERFRQEAKSASRIGHAHIVDISDFGWTPQGAAYFVMEMLQGEDLADLLARERRVAPARAVDITIQCCKALGAAHAKGIIHRDMKPENIFLTPTEEGRDFVKIVDFGIAKMSDFDRGGEGGRKLTKTGVLFGTPEYMAPEQAAGQGFDHRADLYALGVILYEMLTGKVPFEGDNFLHVLAQHSHDPVPPLRERRPGLQISDALERAVMGALAKDLARRFQNMDAFAAALAATPEARDQAEATHGPRAAALPETPAPTPADAATRRRWMYAVAAITAAGVLGGLLWVGFAAEEEEPEPAPAPQVAAPRAPAAAAASEVEPSGTEQAIATEEEPAGSSTEKAATAEEAPAIPEEARGQEAETVTLHVRTRPEGARVFVEGRGEVCARTPCEVGVERGTKVALSARRGRVRAATSFVAESEREVALRLRRPTSRKPSRSNARQEERRDRTGSGDLKIPEIFRK